MIIPQIQYEDLGLTLKATPTIQKSGAVSMHIDLKINALAGTALNNIPILNNRQFVSDITVDDGTTALLVSTLSKSESAAVSGIPGLGELPGFQTATADKIDRNRFQRTGSPHHAPCHSPPVQHYCRPAYCAQSAPAVRLSPPSTGSHTVNTVPCRFPRRVFVRIDPSCFSTMPLLTHSPRPVPINSFVV